MIIKAYKPVIAKLNNKYNIKVTAKNGIFKETNNLDEERAWSPHYLLQGGKAKSSEGGDVVEELFLKIIHFSVFISYCFEDFEHNTSFSFSCQLVNMWNRIPIRNLIITFVGVTLISCSTFPFTNNFLDCFAFFN